MKLSKCCTIIPSVSHHTATFIFLHGLGGHGVDQYKPMIETYIKPILPDVKFILPQASTRKMTYLNGEEKASWFDIIEGKPGAAEDLTGMIKSAIFLQKIIKSEIKSGIDASRIFLGGHSQGGAQALFTGIVMALQLQFKGEKVKKSKNTVYNVKFGKRAIVLGGLVSLSGYLPGGEMLKKIFSDRKNLLGGVEKVKWPAIFMAHGEKDQIIPLKWSMMVKNALLDYFEIKKVTFSTYAELEHAYTVDEVCDLVKFLSESLSLSKDKATGNKCISSNRDKDEHGISVS